MANNDYLIKPLQSLMGGKVMIDDPNIKRTKKDAIWKPLLRGFRSFMRLQIAKFVDINRIHDYNGEVNYRTIEACKACLREFDAPEEFQSNNLYQHALLVLLAPSSFSNLDKFFNGLPSVQKSLPVIKQIFCRIFRENSIKLRVKFFSNELV